EIGDSAFEYCEMLSEISLPEGLETIGYSAFGECEALAEITLPESLTELGVYAFHDCKALESVHIPAKVAPDLKTGWYAFAGCTGLKSVTVDADNSVLASVDGVLYSKDLSQLVCYPGAKADPSFDIPASVNTVLSSAFGELVALRHLNIGKNVRFEDVISGGISHVCYEGNSVRWEAYTMANALDLPEDLTVHFEADESVFEENLRTADCFNVGGVYVECTLCDFEYCAETTSEPLGHVLDGTVCTECDTDLLAYLSTTHPYSSNMNRTWEVKLRGAECFHVTFSEETYTEYCDWIELYDAQGELIGRYSRDDLAGETVNVYSDTLRITMTSDGSVEYYGFAITDIAIGTHVAQTHTVNFYDYYGDFYYTTTVEHGKAADAPYDPFEYGYRFVAWDQDFSCVTGDMEIYPIFRPALMYRGTTGNSVVANGKNASATVFADGEGLSYKWYYKDKGSSAFKLTTAFKGNTYKVAMNAARSGRQVYCVITDKYGDECTSDIITLSMKARIKTQPKSVQAAKGKTAKVTVSAEGEGLTYKWYYKDKGSKKFARTTAFKGATYSVQMTAARSGRQVYCVVTDKYGNTVTTKIVTLSMKARIATQPKSVTVAKNKTAKVTVKAEGEGLKYTWYVKNAGAKKFTKSSIKSATYSVQMTSKVNGRKVYCKVTDKFGNTVASKTVSMKQK
ncbi:MAG: leucine-rich repeat protein, partial [Clostridia bacterium]|nr:leucine-rich repeat protein [Clostridia bacterium]